jgi:hypothetical protein
MHFDSPLKPGQEISLTILSPNTSATITLRFYPSQKEVLARVVGPGLQSTTIKKFPIVLLLRGFGWKWHYSVNGATAICFPVPGAGFSIDRFH